MVLIYYTMSDKNIRAKRPYTNKPMHPQDAKKTSMFFEKLVKTFYDASPYVKDAVTNHELEVKFGTKSVRPHTKIDYDNVIRKLKSLGFSSTYEDGYYLLRISYEYLDKSGQYKDSNIRVEITGFRAIQEYCKTNDLMKLMNVPQYASSVKFVKKAPVYQNNDMVRDVNFYDFNFRVSYKKEEDISPSSVIIRSMLQNWRQVKKTYRYINRVSFSKDATPLLFDISIVKSSAKEGYNLKKTYSTEESGVFSSVSTYEMEIEVDNTKIGPGTPVNTQQSLVAHLRKGIKYIMMGLQGTNYPISVTEQKSIIQGYMKLLHGKDYNDDRRVYPKNFIGPSSYTLQQENIIPKDDNVVAPNIRKNYVVTDKADGERNLMYIANDGKIYLITTNMSVVFTGAMTEEKTLFHSLYDGELILHNKRREFINLYAIFDVYFVNGQDTRALMFMDSDDDEKKLYRYKIIKNTMTLLNAKGVVGDDISPMRFQPKMFYPETPDDVENDLEIFAACKHILSKVHNGLFEYETDGLIFTHTQFGVGTAEVGKAGPLHRVTWDYSFKWKPPEFNTIDFLVVTRKVNGEDMITPIFQSGVSSTDLDQYKTIELRCGYNQKLHGYINPCQEIYEDKVPEYGDKDDARDYRPVLFVPTKPYDPTAGICKIMLKRDDTGILQMFTEDGEVFDDHTIVEFKYVMDHEKDWRWVPIRVRNDKTTELKQGISLNYGNAYHVAESNWRSIHNPITEEIISSGYNIQDVETDEDVYYNRIVNTKKTLGLRSFHNYIKSKLIQSVSQRGDTLIDLACGKGGDFPKWTDARLSFVFGIDKSKDNLENRMDGACARFLNYRKSRKHVPHALFVQGDVSDNIKDGSALKSDKGIQITNAIFGQGPKDETRLGRGVVRQYGKGVDGFNITSCQFALHYFFESISTIQNFVRNLAECTKLNGYFVATSYDGKSVFNMLKNKEVNDGVSIYEGGQKIWEIKKRYSLNAFDDDSTSLHYTIDVFQESINQSIPEYLVNYDYFERVMEDYGFALVTREEAKEMGMPDGTGLFSDLYTLLVENNRKSRNSEFMDAMNMNEYEKKISFLNRYVIYKKIRVVNTAKVILHEEEEADDTIMQKEVEASVIDVMDDDIAAKSAQPEQARAKKKPRRLTKKIVIKDESSSSSA